MITDQHIRTILEFLKRVQMSGQEAPVFMDACAALGSMLQPMSPPRAPSVGVAAGEAAAAANEAASASHRVTKARAATSDGAAG